MHLSRLSVTDFRNIAHVELVLSPSVNVLYGANASGKTNFLEATFLLLTGRSQRSASGDVLVRQGGEYFRISGALESDERTRELTHTALRGGKKRILVDEVPVRLSELFSLTSAVSSGPEDTEIIFGPPSSRRFFLDFYLSQASGTYLRELTSYSRALEQKNSALKSGQDAEPFNELLVAHGTNLVFTRLNLLEELSVRAAVLYRDISDGVTLELSYRDSLGLAEGVRNREEIETTFRSKLADIRRREVSVEMALAGPHRDDMHVMIGAFPARSHCSQGESRTAALALKLAVYHFLERVRGVAPVLLLDEVFAELDPDRGARLLSSLERFGQILLTTAGGYPVGLPDDARTFRIVAGTPFPG